MKNQLEGKSNVKKAYVDMTSDEHLFNDVKDTLGYKRGYEKEMIAELIEEVKIMRQKRGLSQQKFAMLIGTKQQVVARLEKNGAKDMKLSTFLNIINALHLDPKKLLHC